MLGHFILSKYWITHYNDNTGFTICFLMTETSNGWIWEWICLWQLTVNHAVLQYYTQTGSLNNKLCLEILFFNVYGRRWKSLLWSLLSSEQIKIFLITLRFFIMPYILHGAKRLMLLNEQMVDVSCDAKLGVKRDQFLGLFLSSICFCFEASFPLGTAARFLLRSFQTWPGCHMCHLNLLVQQHGSICLWARLCLCNSFTNCTHRLPTPLRDFILPFNKHHHLDFSFLNSVLMFNSCPPTHTAGDVLQSPHSFIHQY